MKKFEGFDVSRVAVAVTNAGDGLSKALGVEPVDLKIGQTVYLAMEAKVVGVNHRTIRIEGEDTDLLERVAKLRAQTATIVDAEAVAEAIDVTRRKIEAAAGVGALNFGDDDADES